MNQRDLIHKWAHGLNDASSGGAVYASGGTLLSYGFHFPLGIRCGQAPDGRPRYLLNNRSYSVTTTKHQSWTAGATHHGECLSVPLFDGPSAYSFHQTAEALEKELRRAAGDTLSRGPRKQAQAHANVARVVDAAKRLLDFAKGCGVTLDKPTKALLRRLASVDVSKAAESVKAEKERAERAAKRAQAKRVKDERADLARWLAGEDVWRSFEALALRVAADGKTVETSHGARVSIAAARLLWQGWGSPELVGRSVDGYRVNEARKEALVIGCHTIERAEAERFAKAQGWD